MAFMTQCQGLALMRVCLAATLCVAWAAGAAFAQTAASVQGSQGSTSVTIHTQKQGNAVLIEARAVLTAPLTLIWETLTDYEKFHTFVPGMHVSRVMERRGYAVTVKQQGEAGFLIFTQAIDVVVEALEKPPHVITVRMLSGNLKKLDGRYQIEPNDKVPGQYVLHWAGMIEPQTRLPPLIGVPILRANISDQFRGMVREIERRVALLPIAIKVNE
jgi:ribosome-associated toxin RatA of RatAB toxin-antitoxin module